MDFFQEPQKETNSDSKTVTKPIIDPQSNYEEIAMTAEFLDRMGELDILESTVSNDKGIFIMRFDRF